MLLHKLSFLSHLMKEGAIGVGVVAVRSIMVDGCESWSLVQECRQLEEGFGAHYVDEILNGGSDVMCMMGSINKLDLLQRLKRGRERAPQIAEVASIVHQGINVQNFAVHFR